jgi:hypothetical protein
MCRLKTCRLLLKIGLALRKTLYLLINLRYFDSVELVAHSLLALTSMTFECKHCGVLISGKAYRVTSEEAGVKLLDMIVCHSCFVVAQRLGLRTEEMNRAAPVPESRSTHGESLH